MVRRSSRGESYWIYLIVRSRGGCSADVGAKEKTGKKIRVKAGRRRRCKRWNEYKMEEVQINVEKQRTSGSKTRLVVDFSEPVVCRYADVSTKRWMSQCCGF